MMDCNLFVHLKESVYKRCKCVQSIPSDGHDVFLDFLKKIFNLFSIHFVKMNWYYFDGGRGRKENSEKKVRILESFLENKLVDLN